MYQFDIFRVGEQWDFELAKNLTVHVSRPLESSMPSRLPFPPPASISLPFLVSSVLVKVSTFVPEQSSYGSENATNVFQTVVASSSSASSTTSSTSANKVSNQVSYLRSAVRHSDGII